MNKKNKNLDDFFNKRKKEISFITLKKGAIIKIKEKEYVLEDELPMPIRVDSLIKDIKQQEDIDGINIKNIIDGIIYIQGTDVEFRYLKQYKDILNNLNFDLKAYITLFINDFSDDKINDSVVYGKALINILEDEKSCFIYASTLEHKAMQLNDKGYEKQSQTFMEQAHFYYEKALNYDEKFPLAYYKLGYYYKLKQQYIKANLFWTKHQELDEDIERVEEIRNEIENLKPYVDFETGYNLVLNEKPNEGLDLLLPLVNNYSGWWNLLFFIGLAYRSLGEYSIAETYYENVLKIDNLQKDALNELGLCKILRKKYTEAAEVFTTLLNVEPRNCEVFCNRAVAYLYNEQLDRAKEDIVTALKINPNDEVALSIQAELNQK